MVWTARFARPPCLVVAVAALGCTTATQATSTATQATSTATQATSTATPATSTATAEAPPEPAIVDSPDRCPILVDCHDGFIDHDGCPDVALSFEPGSSELSSQSLTVLDELASELQALGLARLRIIGQATQTEPSGLAARRASAVANRLRARGVAQTALDVTTDLGDPLVWFDPVDCHDTRDRG